MVTQPSVLAGLFPGTESRGLPPIIHPTHEHLLGAREEARPCIQKVSGHTPVGERIACGQEVTASVRRPDSKAMAKRAGTGEGRDLYLRPEGGRESGR